MIRSTATTLATTFLFLGGTIGVHLHVALEDHGGSAPHGHENEPEGDPFHSPPPSFNPEPASFVSRSETPLIFPAASPDVPPPVVRESERSDPFPAFDDTGPPPGFTSPPSLARAPPVA